MTSPRAQFLLDLLYYNNKVRLINFNLYSPFADILGVILGIEWLSLYMDATKHLVFKVL